MRGVKFGAGGAFYMSLRFSFLPARLCRTLGNLFALFLGEFGGSSLAALFAVKLS